MGRLPYGLKKRVELARALAAEPKLLMLDEPMAGMGHEDVHTVAEIIREVARTRAVLMVEHNLSVVEDICDHVTVLQRGEILAEGDYAAVAADPRIHLVGHGPGASTIGANRAGRAAVNRLVRDLEAGLGASLDRELVRA